MGGRFHNGIIWDAEIAENKPLKTELVPNISVKAEPVNLDVAESDNGVVITATDVRGTTEARLRHGKDGAPGKDGYTPVKGVDYFDGAPGRDGLPGRDGRDGAPGKDAVVDATMTIPGAAADAAAVGYVLASAYQSLVPAGASIGQVFRVAEIFADGTYRMEPADFAEKEWQLKGTITNPTERITVDMSGCTEMVIKGSSVATVSSSIRDSYSILTQISQNGTMNFTSHFINGLSGFECINGKYARTDTRNAGSNLGTYSALDGKMISDINTLYLSDSQNVTSCNIEIWGR